MGRAMLIIVAGVLISLGITQTSVFGGLNNLAGHSANYAETAQAKNIAYMGTELAIQEMIKDPSWRDGESATFDIDSGSSSVTIEEINTNEYRLISTGTFNDEVQTITMVLRENSSSGVPKFQSALGIIMEDPNDFTFDASGNAGIDGNDASGTCPAVPGVMVSHDDDKNYVENNASGSSNIEGDPPVGVNSDFKFDEVVKLIEALDGPGANYLPGGNYKGSLGTADNPGIFVVNNETKITGNKEGFGILIIKNSGKLQVDAELILRGTMKFNGLVIFENAFAIDGKGTPEIRGSVLAGKSNKWSPKFDVDLGGTADIRYDCEAQKYADMAAAGYVNSNMAFQQLSVYEN